MELKLGIYRHYKGNYYQVMGFARHSETLEILVNISSLSGTLWQFWNVGTTIWNVCWKYYIWSKGNPSLWIYRWIIFKDAWFWKLICKIENIFEKASKAYILLWELKFRGENYDKLHYHFFLASDPCFISRVRGNGGYFFTYCENPSCSICSVIYRRLN